MKDSYHIDLGSLWQSRVKPDRFCFVTEFLGGSKYDPPNSIRFLTLLIDDGQILESIEQHVLFYDEEDYFFRFWKKII